MGYGTQNAEVTLTIKTIITLKKARQNGNQQQPQQSTLFSYAKCGKDCDSRVGLRKPFKEVDARPSSPVTEDID